MNIWNEEDKKDKNANLNNNIEEEFFN